MGIIASTGRSDTAGPKAGEGSLTEHGQVYDYEVPRRAVWLSIAFTCALALINFGPVVGFNAIVSLTIIAITASYTICIAALIWRRFFGKPIPRERFTLG